ncbi:tetratricopeptide repeat protein [Nocardioides nitrophenolicus]|uniref:tetratricopeptide repeat protein n=1 Tax=Nocardioides nitrophenolicus TaxID=60489 RepID=UPI0019563EA9|nr:tetratricopeptide repeat protein [Nocardioides nitrophenolicus]MBM7515880.1 tetratricopeptide (TPR) repeat protein [Nocardioides nitrophenolicus]
MTVRRPASDEGAAWTLDDVAAGLRELRAAAGSPSYARVAERIVDARRDRGLPEAECHVGRVTVYDCFRAGRRRIDADLVAEIVRALGADGATAGHWRERSSAAQHRRDAGMVGTAVAPVPAPEEPAVDRAELAAVLAALDAGTRTVVVDGLAGSGKTHLARRVAQVLVSSGRVAGGILVDLRGFHDDLPPVMAEAALTAAVRALGAGAAPTAQRVRRQQYAGLLRERPQVVVLDDAADEEQVRPLLVGAGPTVHLVTSRRALRIEGATAVTLGSFRPEESVRLLGAIAGSERVAAEPEAATTLAAATGHLPLAVSLVATRVAARTTWPLSDFVTVADARRRGLRIDDAVAATLAATYAALSPAAQRLLRLLSAPPVEQLDDTAVAAVAGTSGPDAEPALAELWRHHLLQRAAPYRLRIHPLVRTFALDRSHDEDRPRERDDAQHRLAHHLLALAWADHVHLRAGSGRPPPPGLDLPDLDADEVRRRIDREADTLLLLAGLADGPLTLVLPDLAPALAARLDLWGRYADGRVLHERAWAVARAARRPDAVLRTRLDLGRTLVRLGELDAGGDHLGAVHPALEEAGLAVEAREALGGLAIVAAQQGRPAEAAALFRRCAALAAETGDPVGEALSLDNVAIVEHRLGNFGEALRHHQLAQQAAIRAGAVAPRALSLVNTATLQLTLGDPEAALAAADEGIRLAETVGHDPVRGYGLTAGGRALVALGRPADGIARHDLALEIARRSGDRLLEASALCGRAVGRLVRDEHAAAGDDFARAEEIAVAAGLLPEQVRARRGLADTAAAAGDDAAAADHLDTARALVEAAPEAERVYLRAWLEGPG